jgi:hypothetical protein
MPGRAKVASGVIASGLIASRVVAGWVVAGGVVAGTVVLSVAVASCASQPPAPAGHAAHPAGAGRATAPGVSRASCRRSPVPGFSCTHPAITVTPATGLRNHQRITVLVTGFAVGGKVALSECAASADVNPAGCGQQLAGQPFLVTGSNRAATGAFTVSSRASAEPYSPALTHACADRCVIVATLGPGSRGGYAYVPVSFRGAR